MLHWRTRTELIAGPGTALDWVRRIPGADRPALAVVFDEAAAPLPPIARVLDAVGPGLAVGVGPGADDWPELLALGDRLRRAGTERVVTVGGGTTTDVARLASLIAANERRRLRTLERTGGTGFRPLPDRHLRRYPLVAITTTLGTGVEVSPVACMVSGGTKRIVLGERLIPDTAILDPDLTGTLPAGLVEDGIVEIMLRYLGPLLAGDPGVAMTDEVVLDELGHLDRLLRTGRRRPLTADERLAVSLRSAATRLGFGLAGRNPYSSKLWYLATALTDCVPVSKLEANLMLFPAVLAAIDAGDHRFGQRPILARVNRRLGLPAAEPLALADHLRSRRRPRGAPTVDPAVVAAHAHRTWGNGRPMLGDLGHDELVDIYRSAGDDADAPAAGPASRVLSSTAQSPNERTYS
ncbi:MAG: iron-containing alcohol dehydrogenase [Acidimicrobiales bacterium]